MWLKSLCVVMVVAGALGSEEFLSQLHGLKGRNKMLLCLRADGAARARSCAGALLHDEWLGVRAACLRGHPLERAVALRPLHGETCDEVTDGYYSPSTRVVQEVFYHPWADFVLVNMNRPYFQLDSHPNSTKWTVSHEFKPHGTYRWMKAYMKEYALKRNTHHQLNMLQYRMMSNTSPLMLFLVTMALPLVLVVLLFIYVVYYAGTTTDDNYKEFTYSKNTNEI